ncbi:SDR family NAD(P)-dependent oxidoreductase [Amycolatopsis sp. ATCC 39116]|uniref:SDR family NAD(P)-dependent oxidoreductase n=1 Tax=Amycolatopsis sp. (strain ATCC 39116 / 75iv2) TaxID=385957 RepID=UPI0002625D3A|nr:SDR family NAD(P)-dependent oxidoreductase [Amycolatopsis sp. ATCC 39116]
MTNLDGKVALVTGASSGLGAHTARIFADHGATVIGAARRADRVPRHGDRIVPLELDITDRVAVREAIPRIAETTGWPDIVVNNAGGGAVKPALEHTDADWDHALAVNLTGAWTVSTVVTEGLRRLGRPGSIVNVASAAGLNPVADTAAYGTSKAALIHLTRQLALEWAPLRIRVNAICPGHFPTEINAEFLADERFRDRITRRIPLGRLGRLDDLTGLVLLLASDASAYLTGAVIPLDGGQSLRS